MDSAKIEKLRGLALCAVFFGLLGGFALWFFLSPDRELSLSERRKLTQAPALTAETVFSGAYFSKLDAYALDQFPARDAFRTAKALFSYNVLQKTDNNGLYRFGAYLCKLDGPLDEQQVLLGAKKLNTLRETYFPDAPCYWAVVPDKNHYAGEALGYPVLSYDRLTTLLRENVRGMTEINLSSALSLSDYYFTDTHWRQEKLQGVCDVLSDTMGLSPVSLDTFTQNTLPGFCGVYAGQSALPVPGEDMIYLTAASTETSQVKSAEADGLLSVYTPQKFMGNDPYDLYLSGAAALLEISTNADTGEELLLFRDSFGSSLAPLLLSSYSKITLIDLRYLSTSLLPQLIDFHGQDVLFLYSSGIFNNSALLR